MENKKNFFSGVSKFLKLSTFRSPESDFPKATPFELFSKDSFSDRF